MGEIADNNRLIKEQLERLKEQEWKDKKLAEKNAVQVKREQELTRELDKLKRETMERDPHNDRLVSYWNQIESFVHEAKKENVASYIDWRAGMFKVLELSRLLNAALHTSINKDLIFPVNSALGNLAYRAHDKLCEKFPDKPPIILPGLHYDVKFTDENKLEIAPVVCADNKQQAGEEINELFGKSVDLWLKDQGYKADPADDGRYKHENTGVTLDKATFDALQADPHKGLLAFLEKGHDLGEEVDYVPVSRGP